jgi:hypothetical protein
MEDHTPHVVIWRGVIVIHVTGPYFFDGNVNGVSYFETWENYVTSDLTSRGIIKQVRLQQNCAPTHFNLTVLLNSLSNFPRIGRFYHPLHQYHDFNSVLTCGTLDDILWGIMKGKLAVRLYNTNTEFRAVSVDAFASSTP